MKKFISLLLIFFMIAGCSRMSVKGRGVATAEKLMDKGRYIDAVLKLEEVLKIYPDYEPAQQAFVVAYPSAVSKAEMYFDEAKYDHKLDSIAESQEKLYLVKSAADGLSEYIKSMIPINYPTQEELDILRGEVAANFYDAAQEFEKKHLNRQQMKKRFYLYKRALYYSPEYMDVKARYQNSKEEALQRVLIKVMPYKYNYTDLGESISQNAVGKIRLNELAVISSYKEFENYLMKIGEDFNEIEKNGIGSKEILTRGNTLVKLEVMNVSCTEPYKTVTSEEKFWIEKYDTETKLGQMVEEVKTPEKPSVEYRTHRYRQYNYTMSNSLSLNVYYKIIDLSNGEIIKSGSVIKTESDAVHWKEYGNYKNFSFKIPDLPPGTAKEYPRDLKSETEMLKDVVNLVGAELAYVISGVLI